MTTPAPALPDQQPDQQPDHKADQPHVCAGSCLSRRRALVGVLGAGVGVPLLAACSGGGTTAADPAGSASSSAASGATTTPGGSSASADAGAAALTTTADVPEGGGTILADANVVVTQPSAGDFKAFSATCTHTGCQVGEVSDGEIICPCHGSRYSIEDGSVVSGPAPSPLPAVSISVDGDDITLA